MLKRLNFMQLFRVGRTGPTLFLAPTATLRKPPAVHPSLRRGFSPEHSIQRLPFIGGQPPPRDGSLGGRRRGGHRVVFVVLRCRQSQRGQSVVPLGQREPAEQQLPGSRFPRALRPELTVSEQSETNVSQHQQERFRALLF